MKTAKNCDNSFMKKMIFLIFVLFFLIFVQLFSSSSNRIFTFHSKVERNILTWIGKTYLILDGTRDENIGSSPKAIYKVILKKNYVRYIVLGREKSTQHDFLLIVNPDSLTIEHKTPLSPYFFLPSFTDFRGLLDLNNDRNQELVCVVNGKSGKRIKIYKITPLGFIDLPFPFLENYVKIQIDDINIDGILDIVCYPTENGIDQVPGIYKLQGTDILLQKMVEFPEIVNSYTTYLNSLTSRTRKSGNPAIFYDLSVAKARMFISLGEEKEFDQLFEQMNFISPEPDITKKIRLYRMKILKSYFLFAKGDENLATRQIIEAIDYMYGKEISQQQRESIIASEKTSYYLFVYDWEKAQKQIEQALTLDSNNAMAGQINRDMGNF
jgi:hypothetical protein